MDRYFSKLEPGKSVTRKNWSISIDTPLYASPARLDSGLDGPGDMHLYEGQEVEPLKSIEPEKCFLRVERQTLYRLPKSRAIVFAFKTYLYGLVDIKEGKYGKGKAEELAEAVDGLKGGSVPATHFYKRGVVWGEAVKRYLRS